MSQSDKGDVLMKLTVKDSLGVEWTHDTAERRFYVTEADKEFEDTSQNGYYCPIVSLLELLIGHNAVTLFDPLTALVFYRNCLKEQLKEF
jgi:hypothetical protein